jgi:hypothetical protein
VVWVEKSGRGRRPEPAQPVVAVGSQAVKWLDMLDVDQRTDQTCRSVYRCQIAPRWDAESVRDVTSSEVDAWLERLRSQGYAPGLVSEIRWVLSEIVADAQARGVIGASPVVCGRWVVEGWRERAWVSPSEVLMVAANAAAVSTVGDGLMIVTAAWTGMRWGEVAGLPRENLHLDGRAGGRLRVGSEMGVVHESAHPVWLGPPKTMASVRWIALPPFLTALLRQHVAGHDASMVFPDAAGVWQRRSCFARRVMRPAADGRGGSRNGRAGRVRVPAVKPGLGFSGLRRSHKVWLVEDGVPAMVQAARLGYVLRDRVEPELCLTPGWEQRVRGLLQARFAAAAGTAPPRVRAFLAAAAGTPVRRPRDAA